MGFLEVGVWEMFSKLGNFQVPEIPGNFNLTDAGRVMGENAC